MFLPTEPPYCHHFFFKELECVWGEADRTTDGDKQTEKKDCGRQLAEDCSLEFHIGSRGGTQFISLDSKTVYSLSHLTSPIFCVFRSDV